LEGVSKVDPFMPRMISCRRYEIILDSSERQVGLCTPMCHVEEGKLKIFECIRVTEKAEGWSGEG
jgi:hypothetical protein